MSDDEIAIAVERVTVAVVEALARGEAPTAVALRFLLRAYAASGSDEIREAIEPALAHALDLAQEAGANDRPAWLVLFAEAMKASQDERLRSVVESLLAGVRTSMRSERLDVAAAAVDACLHASDAALEPASARQIIQQAIDELERIVGGSYQPGEGVSGVFADTIAVASALLTAYQRTGRLPYSMLAEELMQAARRTMRQKTIPFDINCEAVVVLSRLAALHRSAEYREAAVMAPGADYDADAAGILLALAADAPGRGLEGAIYGLAAAERQSVL